MSVVVELKMIDIDHQQPQLALILITASSASRARMPRSCLSLALPRSKLMRIFVPLPPREAQGEWFRKPFLNSVQFELPL
jgi:hypothetical protein